MVATAIPGDPEARFHRAAIALGPTVAALTLPKRALILSEALERPISPSGFAQRWGFEETATVGIFRRMEADGFLQKTDKTRARQASDGSSRGRGRRAQLYTARKGLLLPTQEWQYLPLEVREGHSFVVFTTLMSRISLAINTKTLDRDTDRHFTWKALELDRGTWTELMSRLDELLDWVIVAEKAAERRMSESGEPAISATVALGGFRSPQKAELLEQAQALFGAQPRSETAAITGSRLKRAAVAMAPSSAALTIPLRALILSEALEDPISPSHFAHEWGMEIRTVARHFRKMEETGFLEKFGEAPPRSTDGTNRGRTAQLYRATRSLLYWTEEWEDLPREVREGHSFIVFVTLMARISLALKARTLDRDLDRHFTWKALKLDRVTWCELMVRLDELLEWVVAAEERAKVRMHASGEKPISATVSLGGFRSPQRADLLEAGLK